jgi:uncharacterized membrane protein
MSDKIITLGFALVFIGIFLLFIGMVMHATKGAARTEVGFGGFIGPFPFGFATSPTLLKAIIILSVILAIVFFFLLR